MGIDFEFFIHGVPKGHKVWGDPENPLYSKDALYFQSFYTSETDKFLIEIRDINKTRYCYYSYLKYTGFIDCDNRSGSYFGMTIRTDKYCSDIIGLYQLLDLIYKGYILDLILKREGTKIKFLVPDFKSINKELNQIADIVIKRFEELLISPANYKIDFHNFNIDKTKQIYKINLLDCTEDNIENILHISGIVAISPSYPTFKEDKTITDYKLQIESITKAKETEINSLNNSLLKEKNHSTNLSQQIEQLNTEKKNLQKTIDNLKKDNRNLETVLSREISTKLDPIFENLKTEHTSSVKIGKNKLLPNRLISVIQFILILLTAILCVFHLLKE